MQQSISKCQGHGGSPPALLGLLGSMRRGLRPYLLVVRPSANHHSSRLVAHSHTQLVRAQECDCTRMRRNQRGDLHRDRQHKVPYHWVRGPDARQLGQIQPGVLPDFNGMLDSWSNPFETELACYAEALRPAFVNRTLQAELETALCCARCGKTSFLMQPGRGTGSSSTTGQRSASSSTQKMLPY